MGSCFVRDLMENLGVGETENGSHPLRTPRCGSFELPYGGVVRAIQLLDL